MEYENQTKTDTKSRQALNKSCPTAQWTFPKPSQSPQIPEKVSRTRSNSTSMTSPPSFTRKRTSSGVFQVDESEPLPKKPESSRSQPESPRTPVEPTSNGRKKTDTEDSEKREKATVGKKRDKVEKKNENIEKKNESVDIKDRVIETFDSKAKSNCVTAFKESDSWD